tara:strand:+ start:44 stop:3739 length:3696 start_codon:yes stop_codon:yes gene_type:complete
MASRNIVIESNRINAVRALQNSILSQPETLNSLAEEAPNNSWKTTVESGILIEPGDKIRLESAVIQELGSGSEVIELTGSSNLTIQDSSTVDPTFVGEKLSDNGIDMDLGYYVTNRQQFNFNLPKSRFQTQYNYKDNGYGGPAFYHGGLGLSNPSIADKFSPQSWGSFEMNYPYQYIEGTSVKIRDTLDYVIEPGDKVANVNPAAPAPVALNKYNPSQTRTSKDLFNPSSTRLYVGNKEYTGAFLTAAPAGDGGAAGLGDFNNTTFNTPIQNLNTSWDYFKNTVRLNVDPGFSTPSAVGEILTGQLHGRLGNADNWANETVPAVGKSNDPEAIDDPFPTVTDETYLTFPTAPGKLLYRKQEPPLGLTPPTLEQLDKNNWQAEFTPFSVPTSIAVPNPNTTRGTWYSRHQGQAAYYSNMMTARPKYVKAMSALNLYCQSAPGIDNPTTPRPEGAGETIWTSVSNNFPLDNTSTPMYESYNAELNHAYEVGQLGNNMCFLYGMNGLDNAVPYTWWNNATGAFVTTPSPDIDVDLSQIGLLKTTNLIWNDTTFIPAMKEIFDGYFDVITPTTNTDITDDDFLNSHIMRFNQGRLDDQQTYPGTPGLQRTADDRDKDTYLACPLIINQPQWVAPTSRSAYVVGAGKQWEILATDGKAPVGNQISPFTSSFKSVAVQHKAGSGMEIYVRHYLSSVYTAENAWNSALPDANNGFPEADQWFTYVPPRTFRNGQYDTLEKFKKLWDTIPTVSGGGRLAIIPMFINPNHPFADFYGVNSKDQIFTAFVYADRPWYGQPERTPELLYPQISKGEFFGLSPSEMTCQYSQIVTTQKIYSWDGDQPVDDPEQYPTPLPYDPPDASPEAMSQIERVFKTVEPEAYCPYISIGSNDASITFDPTLSRFGIKKLHTPIKKGNGVFQAPTLGTETAPEQNIISWGEKKAALCRRSVGTLPASGIYVDAFNKITAKVKENCSLSAQSGVGILSINILIDSKVPLDNARAFPLNTYNSLYFNNSLLAKLGFEYEQLCPLYGREQNQFNRAAVNKYLGYGTGTDILKKATNMVYPVTTNAYISGAITIGLSRLVKPIVTANESPAPPTITHVTSPAENLGGTISGESVNTNASSDELVAINLPRKLDGSYLTVLSDIIRNPYYYGGPGSHGRLPCIGYLLKNYTSGDYVFSFQSTIDYTSESKYVLTDIEIDIRNPDGTPARIGENNTIFFKIEKPLILPAPPPEETKK